MSNHIQQTMKDNTNPPRLPTPRAIAETPEQATYKRVSAFASALRTLALDRVSGDKVRAVKIHKAAREFYGEAYDALPDTLDTTQAGVVKHAATVLGRAAEGDEGAAKVCPKMEQALLFVCDDLAFQADRVHQQSAHWKANDATTIEATSLPGAQRR